MSGHAVITGFGVVSAIGSTHESFFAALADGRSGIAQDQGRAESGLPLVARIDAFGAREAIEPRALRRLTRLSQMAVVAAKQALAQAAWDGDATRTGILVGTGLGTIRDTIDFLRGCLNEGPAAASPALFPSSVPNAIAGQMALELGLRGPNSTVNHREISTLAALRMAADFLSLGRADAVLVGGFDELNDYTHHACRRLGALSATGMRPYALDRDGTVLGEGGAVFLLERGVDARRRGARPLATLAGLSLSSSHRPRVGWGRTPDIGSAVATIRSALAEAALSADEVDYVAGAGNGLSLDALEARVIAEALERRADRPVPHGSILGQTGEAMAGAALRIAAALYALERQALPGTVGAGRPDPAAPLPGLVGTPRSAAVYAVLVPSFSQGGADAALVLTRAG